MRARFIVVLLAIFAVPSFGLEPYLAKDLHLIAADADSNPSDFGALGDISVFFADDGLSGKDLWRSDGTAEGTYLLADTCKAEDECSGGPQFFLNTGRFYFFLTPLERNRKARLWVSDGSLAGTYPLTEALARIQHRGLWVASQGLLYFRAEDAEHGLELWRTDGTPAGTFMISDVSPGSASSSVDSMVELKGKVYFSADDGSSGGGLWRTDGSPGSAVLVKDPMPSSPTNSRPYSLATTGSRLTFMAPTSKGDQLWSSDGTAKGTVPITNLPIVRLWDSVVRRGRRYFVLEDTIRGQELWVSDGTARGTLAVTAFSRKDSFFSNQFWLLLPRTPLVGDRFYFIAHDGAHGQELWVTDGTATGTRLVHDICPGSCNSHIFAPFLLRDRLLFVANDGIHSQELWRTDGTSAGTFPISDFEPILPWTYAYAAVVNDQLLFGVRDGIHGNELWRTDGTFAGTQLVKDINEGD